MDYTIELIDRYCACGVDGIHLYAPDKYDDVSCIARNSGIVGLK